MNDTNYQREMRKNCPGKEKYLRGNKVKKIEYVFFATYVLFFRTGLDTVFSFE